MHLLDADEAAGIGQGQGTEQDSANQREHQRVRADRQGDRGERGGREDRAPDQDADGLTELPHASWTAASQAGLACNIQPMHTRLVPTVLLLATITFAPSARAQQTAGTAEEKTSQTQHTMRLDGREIK